jgi:hypothetical protein
MFSLSRSVDAKLVRRQLTGDVRAPPRPTGPIAEEKDDLPSPTPGVVAKPAAPKLVSAGAGEPLLDVRIDR